MSNEKISPWVNFTDWRLLSVALVALTANYPLTVNLIMCKYDMKNSFLIIEPPLLLPGTFLVPCAGPALDTILLRVKQDLLGSNARRPIGFLSQDSEGGSSDRLRNKKIKAYSKRIAMIFKVAYHTCTREKSTNSQNIFFHGWITSTELRCRQTANPSWSSPYSQTCSVHVRYSMKYSFFLVSIYSILYCAGGTVWYIAVLYSIVCNIVFMNDVPC